MSVSKVFDWKTKIVIVALGALAFVFVQAGYLDPSIITQSIVPLLLYALGNMAKEEKENEELRAMLKAYMLKYGAEED